MKNNIIILLILAIGLLLRAININGNPPSLYGDELTMVLDVNSIIHTGYDITGKFLPLNFSMGGSRPVGYGYFSMPFILLFGPTELGIRALSMLSGIWIILFVYLLSKILLSKKIGIIAAMLTAVSVWDISLSRAGFESHFALFLTLSGTYFFLVGFRNPKLFVLSALSFAAAIHTYSTYKLTVPILLIFLFLFARSNKQLINIKSKFYPGISVLILLVALSIVGIQAIFVNSESRFLSLNFLANEDLKQEIIQKVNYDLNSSNLNRSITKIFHNQPVEYLKIFIEKYLNNLSINYLFLQGDGNPRHNMGIAGAFYLVEFVTLILGFVYLINSNKKVLIFLVAWILLGILPSALLLESHFLRSSLMFPPLTILSAAGFAYLLKFKDKRIKIAVIILSVIIFMQFLFFIERLFFVSPNQFGKFWSYSAKLAVQEAIKNKDNYEYIIISDRINDIEFAYPVYAKISPGDVLVQNNDRVILNGLKFKRYGNVYIGNIPQSEVEKFTDGLSGHSLYIGLTEDSKYVNNFEFLEIDETDELILSKKFR